MAILDTSGVYSDGDDFRVIKALDLPFGTYTLSCVAGCLNDLEDMSVTAATDLVALLDAYDVADAAGSAENLGQVGGQKVLIKADVLEYEVINGGVSGATMEMSKIRGEIAQTMAFCTCVAGFFGGQGGATQLIRS